MARQAPGEVVVVCRRLVGFTGPDRAEDRRIAMPTTEHGPRRRCRELELHGIVVTTLAPPISGRSRADTCRSGALAATSVETRAVAAAEIPARSPRCGGRGEPDENFENLQDQHEHDDGQCFDQQLRHAASGARSKIWMVTAIPTAESRTTAANRERPYAVRRPTPPRRSATPHRSCGQVPVGRQGGCGESRSKPGPVDAGGGVSAPACRTGSRRRWGAAARHADGSAHHRLVRPRR